MPTQAEIKNRAEVNFGNPDLHTQRTQKLEQAGIITPEERASMQDFEQNVLGKTNNQMGEQVNESTQSTINPGQKTPLSEAKLPNPDHVTPADYVRSAETRRPIKDSQGQKVDTSLSNIIDSSGFDVKKKVNMLDYFRTPDRVLQKIGLGKEAAQLRGAYDGYLKELPQEIDRVTQWSKQVPPEENQSLFRYLDGQAPKSSLSPQTQKVAGQIKAYLGQWADRLGLPEDKRITNYITHIFDKEGFTKEIDPDLAKIIRDKVAGSVYDPFTEKRLGALGYKEDTWAALDAYVKRATRKVNMDPVLNTISQKAENLEESQFDYVKKYIAGVNMQPTKIDNLIDNTIKQVVGYKFGARPVTYLTKTLRQAGFRGSLGLNVGSALRNLTQGVNTYAKLGEKYTTVGYAKLAKAMATGDKELEDQGILRNDFVQDRTISAKKQVIQKMDKGLFSLFELAEKINRGSAYFGAKAKYLAEHKNASEQDAINYAKDIVAKTQFNFGQVDSPAVLRSDIAKTLGQFQSYNVKQAEFLGEMVKNKEFAGLARYTIGTLALATTIGKLFGMKPTDMIPFSGVLTGQTKLGQTPAINAVEQTATALTPGAKDKYGNPLTLQDRAGMIGNAVIPLIPAGVQAKKTFQGLQTVGQGYAANASGNVQIPMQQNVGNFVRGALFGKSYLPGVQDYYNSGNKPLSKDQSALFKQLPTQGRQDFFNQTMTDRQQNKVIDKITSGSTQPSTVKGAQPASFTIQDKQINGYQVGDKYVYKDDSSGKWKTASVSDVQKGQLTYAEDLAGSQMTAAKNADDINAWVDAAKVQYASLQKQLQDPSLSKLDKLKLQNKVDSLTSQMEKYLGYGGFTKPKKAKFKTPTFVPLNVNAHTNNALFQKTATLQAPRMPIQNVRFNVPSVQMPQGNLSVPDFKARVKFNL